MDNYFFAKKLEELRDMEEINLIKPCKEYEKQAYEYVKEFAEYKSQVQGAGGLNRYDNYDEWLLKLERDLDIDNIPEGRVPANTYFLVRKSDNKILGMTNVRHKLSKSTEVCGGHIGYSIRPTERKNGYGTLILKLALERCEELKISRILVTCDKSNVGSAKVIKNNGGMLENEVYSEEFGGIVQRYWISL